MEWIRGNYSIWEIGTEHMKFLLYFRLISPNFVKIITDFQCCSDLFFHFTMLFVCPWLYSSVLDASFFGNAAIGASLYLPWECFLSPSVSTASAAVAVSNVRNSRFLKH